MNSNVNETPEKPTQRTVFFVSDATAITAETLANAVLAQFHGLKYLRYRMPFVNTEEKAKAAALRINEVGKENGVRPIVFSTLVAGSLASTFNEYCNAFVIELFRAPSSDRLSVNSVFRVTTPSARAMKSVTRKDTTVVLMRLTTRWHTTTDQTNKGLEDADVVLVGVSRSGKTPTSLYLAMQYGIKAANYPLIPEDFERGELPPALENCKDKIFGLSISPKRLSEIRGERRPNSKYASIENCEYEVEEAQRMMDREGIKYLSSTSKSIEEISATILLELKINIDPHMSM